MSGRRDVVFNITYILKTIHFYSEGKGDNEASSSPVPRGDHRNLGRNRDME